MWGERGLVEVTAGAKPVRFSESIVSRDHQLLYGGSVFWIAYEIM